MKKSFVVFIIIMFVVQSLGYAQRSYVKTIQLPAPDTSGGKPLMRALKERSTSRSFSDKTLPQQVISNLLWAGFGINRPDGHRTAPSAMNWQEVEIYVSTKDGLYLYDPQANQLGMLMSEDIREKTGTQKFVADAPMTLVYVADNTKTKRASAEDQTRYTFADCGFIAENVYLCCASEGLACVVRGSVDRPSLAKAMNLSSDQRILLAQTIGYPK